MEMHNKENHNPSNNIQNEDDAVTPHPHERKKNEYVAKTSQKREHERKLDLSRQNQDVATRHRKIQDETRDSVKTGSNGNVSNDIKGLELNGQLAVVEQAISSSLCKNVTNLDIVVCDANETYSVIIDNIRMPLERVVSTSVKSFLMGSSFLESLE